MIRVLQVIHSMNLGGAENFLMNVYRRIDKESVQFDFLVNEDGTFDAEITQMGGKIWKILYVNEVGPFVYQMELKNFFRNHAEYRIIHSHLGMVSGIVIECAKKAGVYYCITHAHSTNARGNFFVRKLKEYYKRKIDKYVDLRLACSKQAGDWLYGGAPVLVINNGIDVDKFQFQIDMRQMIRKQCLIPDDAIVIGHVGRFDQVKNHQYLIEVFEALHIQTPSSFLMLCGDGAEKEAIRKMVAQKNIQEYVVFIDACLDAYKYYNAFDVFVFPSLYEGISLAMIEAQANGLPMVVSDSVDKAAALTNNVSFVSLKSGLDLWVKEIEIARIRGRKDERDCLKSAGFDIDGVARQLLEYYKKGTAD